MFDVISYVLSRKYVKESLKGLGALKGAPCKIKNVVHQDGVNTITFEWEGNDGTKRETTISVYDGTPIYVWESGDTYHYGDLVIYESAFYRCIVENSDVDFDDTKWNEIGSPDGNYDIVATKDLLPARFTSADRKMYYVIDEMTFYLWDGYNWIAQMNVVQYTTMPTASAKFLDRVVQYVGATNANYTNCYFYKCVSNGATPAVYSWENCQVDNDLEVWRVMGKMGAKNLLVYPYVDTTKTYRGIEFTDLGDGGIKANGTATQTAYFNIFREDANNRCAEGEYVVTCKGVSANVRIQVYSRNDSTAQEMQFAAVTQDNPSAKFNYTWVEGYDLRVRVVILSDSEIDNVTLYPMLRFADDQDDTWQPYAPTNRKLNELIDDVSSNVYRTQSMFGVKNLLKYPYTYLPNNPYENNGITYVINDDGSITIDGTTATAYSVCNLLREYELFDKNNQYIMSVEGLTSGVEFQIGYVNGNTFVNKVLCDSSKPSKQVTITDEYDGKQIGIRIVVTPNSVIDNVTIYPMIRLAEDPDEAWVPYAKTNKELTDNVNTLNHDVEVLNDIPIAKGTGTGAVIVNDTTNNIASGAYAYASGYTNVSSGQNSYTEGQGSQATANSSHAEGFYTKAMGMYSHAQNRGTIAQGRAQTALGRFNVYQGTTTESQPTDQAVIIGNGTDDSNRSNALAVQWDGTVVMQDGSTIKSAKTVYKVMGKMGAKNLLSYPYDTQSKTNAGVVWTIHDDGSVTANGTASQYSFVELRTRENPTTPRFIPIANDYIASLGKSAIDTNVYMLVRLSNASTGTVIWEQNIANTHKKITFSNEEIALIKGGTYTVIFRIFMNANATVDNVTVYPMLRFADDQDDTWQPYAETNYDLTKDSRKHESDIQTINTTIGNLGTAATKNSTDRVSPNNTDLVESQSVYSAINTALSSIYTPAGEITCAELTSSLLIAANVGNVYELSDAGTTTALFLQGAGTPLAIGDSVGIINAGQGRILFNLMANRIDLSAFQKKLLTSPVESATTVEGALGALSANKVAKVAGKGLSTNDYDDTEKQKVTNAIQKSQTAGLVKNDGTIDETAYAKQSEMSITDGTGADAGTASIQLKTGTSKKVLTEHQDISDKQTVIRIRNESGEWQYWGAGRFSSSTTIQDIITYLNTNLIKADRVSIYSNSMSNTFNNSLPVTTGCVTEIIGAPFSYMNGSWDRGYVRCFDYSNGNEYVAKIKNVTIGAWVLTTKKTTTKEVSTSSWTSDTTSQSGTTLYKKTISLSHVYVDSPSVDIGAASGSVLPTAAQQTAYDLLKYATIDGTTLTLYASAVPATTFYINVEGAD